jgi:hypothetical protein
MEALGSSNRAAIRKGLSFKTAGVFLIARS